MSVTESPDIEGTLSMEEVLALIREGQPPMAAEEATQALLRTSRLMLVSVDDFFPEIADEHIDRTGYEGCLVVPGIPNLLLAAVGDYEDALAFCNRLQKTLEYHIYPRSFRRH